jgi:DTW domain-containing protein YfiP
MMTQAPAPLCEDCGLPPWRCKCDDLPDNDEEDCEDCGRPESICVCGIDRPHLYEVDDMV